MADINEKIAERTGLTLATVEKITAARLRFQFAVGIAHGDEADEAKGAEVREKYPTLLRDRVVRTAGSESNPITYELEASITQLECQEPMKDVCAVIIAEDEAYGVVSLEQAVHYRKWAQEWLSGGKHGRTAKPEKPKPN